MKESGWKWVGEYESHSWTKPEGINHQGGTKGWAAKKIFEASINIIKR